MRWCGASPMRPEGGIQHKSRKKNKVMEKINRKSLFPPTQEPAVGSWNLADVGSKPVNKGGLHITSR